MEEIRAVDNRVLRVSEIFSSFQGEGASAGLPSVFLRLALCNLRCQWCDTKYTWDFRNYRYESEVQELDVGAVLTRLTALLGEPSGLDDGGGRRLVITGGEPLLQQSGLALLLASLAETLPVEVETNGTIAPISALCARVTQWNVSPKLANSGDPLGLRWRPQALALFRAMENAWLKLVVVTPSDLEEADELVAKLEWPRNRTMLMPEASDRMTLAARMPWVSEAADTRGWRASPRLHIERYGSVRGV